MPDQFDHEYTMHGLRLLVDNAERGIGVANLPEAEYGVTVQFTSAEMALFIRLRLAIAVAFGWPQAETIATTGKGLRPEPMWRTQ